MNTYWLAKVGIWSLPRFNYRRDLRVHPDELATRLRQATNWCRYAVRRPWGRRAFIRALNWNITRAHVVPGRTQGFVRASSTPQSSLMTMSPEVRRASAPSNANIMSERGTPIRIRKPDHTAARRAMKPRPFAPSYRTLTMYVASPSPYGFASSTMMGSTDAALLPGAAGASRGVRDAGFDAVHDAAIGRDETTLPADTVSPRAVAGAFPCRLCGLPGSDERSHRQHDYEQDDDNCL